MSTTTVTAPFLTREQVETITNTLADFKFFGNDGKEWTEMNRNHFVRSLNDPDSYFGGMFEYTNRQRGIRVHIALRGGVVRYANLSLDGAWSEFLQNDVDAANVRLDAVLAN